MQKNNGAVIAFSLVALLLIGGSVLLLLTRPAPAQITLIPPVPTPTPAPTSPPAPLKVYITGAVHQPDTLLTLPHGSRVDDALSASGGTRPDADLSRVNRAAILRDGDQVHVPVMGEAQAVPTTSGGEIVNINTATAEELTTLPGIGPALAERIITYRETHGGIKDYADLDNVSGVGESVLGRLQGRLAF